MICDKNYVENRLNSQSENVCDGILVAFCHECFNTYNSQWQEDNGNRNDEMIGSFIEE